MLDKDCHHIECSADTCKDKEIFNFSKKERKKDFTFCMQVNSLYKTPTMALKLNSTIQFLLLDKIKKLKRN